MSDTSQDVTPNEQQMTAREKELAERAGGRMLIIWFLGLIVAVEAMVIVHLVNK